MPPARLTMLRPGQISAVTSSPDSGMIVDSPERLWINFLGRW
jgi:hypothetical protein